MTDGGGGAASRGAQAASRNLAGQEAGAPHPAPGPPCQALLQPERLPTPAGQRKRAPSGGAGLLLICPRSRR